MYDTSNALSNIEFVSHTHFPEWAHRVNCQRYCPELHKAQSVLGMREGAQAHDPELCATPYCQSVIRLRTCHQSLIALTKAEVIDWAKIHDEVNSHFTDFCTYLFNSTQKSFF